MLFHLCVGVYVPTCTHVCCVCAYMCLLYTCMLCVYACAHMKCLYLCSMGAPVMVELEGETDPLKIATKELK